MRELHHCENQQELNFRETKEKLRNVRVSRTHRRTYIMYILFYAHHAVKSCASMYKFWVLTCILWMRFYQFALQQNQQPLI